MLFTVFMYAAMYDVYLSINVTMLEVASSWVVCSSLLTILKPIQVRTQLTRPSTSGWYYPSVPGGQWNPIPLCNKKIQEMIILLNTGEDGLLTVNHMPTRNEQDLTYGTTHHKRINQLRNTMQIFSTKARLHCQRCGQKKSNRPYPVMLLSSTLRIMI